MTVASGRIYKSYTHTVWHASLLTRNLFRTSRLGLASGFSGDHAGGFSLLRSYAYELYLIVKEQDEGSQRQQAVFKLAKRSFDRGDGARLTTGMPL